MELRDLLTGGDRRSIARANEAVAISREDPIAIDELARLTADVEPLVSSRACDVLEKLAHENPTWVQRHRTVFLACMNAPYWEARLQCARAVALFEWSEIERPRVIEALRKRIDDEQKFVRCWALNSFAVLVGEDPQYWAELDERIAKFLTCDSPSMRARARAIAKRLDR
jgi:HEAT repeat protein